MTSAAGKKKNIFVNRNPIVRAKAVSKSYPNRIITATEAASNVPSPPGSAGTASPKEPAISKTNVATIPK